MSWMARAVQLPAQQGEVAVVLRGGKGVGKGILGHILRKLFGQHGMYISQSKHLVGAFNAHLRDCVFLFADEAFFAGDKSSEGVLKSLITEDVITIEPKGQNAILCKNRLHTLMASNEKWVVPASLDERRFLILDVSNAHFGDYPYFDKIKTEMEAGGYEAMLHDLLNYDISGFNVRRVPGTAALDDQKKLSLLHELQWWHDVLARRYVYRSKHGLEAYFGRWHDLVSTEILFDSYQDFAKSRNVRHPMTRVSFGRFMTTMGCKPSRPSKDGVTGEHQVRSEVTGLLRAEPITKDRPPGYLLGTLEVARQAFEAHTKLPFDWDAEEETAEAAIAEPHEPQEQP
jgi:phage/plasmid-associated DNA primase